MGMGTAAFAGHQRSYRFTTDLLAATTLEVKVATQEYLISSILELILSDLCIHLIGYLVMPPRTTGLLGSRERNHGLIVVSFCVFWLGLYLSDRRDRPRMQIYDNVR